MAHGFAAGSMGPKVAAACQFARQTGHCAAIGNLHDAVNIVRGVAGTLIGINATPRAFL